MSLLLGCLPEFVPDQDENTDDAYNRNGGGTIGDIGKDDEIISLFRQIIINPSRGGDKDEARRSFSNCSRQTYRSNCCRGKTIKMRLVR